ncbi:MAG: NAD-dependent epimerase/dehydratase family protein [Deltaproteobacteria bacterium]|nr:NAD-dependent epimerase/dehydratase family protein [Deltaproteobacteria bacterium]MBI3293574.1 NAD-dependent epimerase/dehydratase family protein [Deltaproteobacteria bacterium]
MKLRVAVTGAAGFIGSNLCSDLMAQGFEVVGIDDLSAGTLENVQPGIDFRKIDIRDERLAHHLTGCETVFHLAAKNCLLDCARNPVETALINVAGTANVLGAMVEAGVHHIVYSDTSAEYEGITIFPSPVNAVRPLSVYACSKRGGALVCESVASLHRLTATFVRYFNVYGPAQDWRRVVPPVMSAFTIQLLSGKRPTIYGDGSKSRDFIHVDDVNSFHRMLLTEPAFRGKTYNLGSGKAHTVLDIFERIEELLRTGLSPLFKDDLPGEAQKTLADTSETLHTGWTPHVSLEEGLKRFVDYTRRRMNEGAITASERPDLSTSIF